MNGISHRQLLTPTLLAITMSLVACGGGGGKPPEENPGTPSSSSNSSSNSSTSNNSSSSSSSSTTSSSSSSTPNQVSVGGIIYGLEESVTLSLNGNNETFNSDRFTFSDKIVSGEDYNVEFVSASADIGCSVLKAVGVANEDVSDITISCTPKALEAYLCASHTATSTNVIGNNHYEFYADNEQCFGTVKDFSLAKREVSLELDTSEANSEYLSISTSGGKLAHKTVPDGEGDSTILYFSFDLTNTSPSILCLNFKNREGATLRDGENVIDSFSVELVGDMFYANGKYENTCIPSGETRIAWARSVLSLGNNLEKVNNILIQPDDIDLYSIEENQYFLPTLTPVSSVWASNVKKVAGNASYHYQLTSSLTNNTQETIELRSESVNTLFFDEQGYLIEQLKSSVADYLEKSPNDLSKDDLTLSPGGNILNMIDEYSSIVPAYGATAQILGRSEKLVIHLDTCLPADCNIKP